MIEDLWKWVRESSLLKEQPKPLKMNLTWRRRRRKKKKKRDANPDHCDVLSNHFRYIKIQHVNDLEHTHTHKENEQNNVLIHFLCLCPLLQNFNLLKVAYSDDHVNYEDMSSFTFPWPRSGISTDSSVHHSLKNFHFRRDVNELLCRVERSNKMTLTLSFR